jgi:hypothetical protein
MYGSPNNRQQYVAICLPLVVWITHFGKHWGHIVSIAVCLPSGLCESQHKKWSLCSARDLVVYACDLCPVYIPSSVSEIKYINIIIVVALIIIIIIIIIVTSISVDIYINLMYYRKKFGDINGLWKFLCFGVFDFQLNIL